MALVTFNNPHGDVVVNPDEVAAIRVASRSELGRAVAFGQAVILKCGERLIVCEPSVVDVRRRLGW